MACACSHEAPRPSMLEQGGAGILHKDCENIAKQDSCQTHQALMVGPYDCYDTAPDMNGAVHPDWHLMA